MTSDRSERQQNYTRPDDEAGDPATTSAADSRERRDHVMEKTTDLLEEIDMAMREAVGLDKDASEEEFTRRADEMAKQFVQKGGQ